MSIVSLPTTLNNLRRTAGNDPRAQLEVASEQFEALFLQQILKQMRKAGDVLSAGNPMRSRELDTMRDFYDEVLAETLAQKKQTGISDLLVRQLSGGTPSAAQLAAAEHSARGAELQRSSIASVNVTPLAGVWRRGVETVEHAWQRGSAAFSALVDSVIKHESGGNVAALSPKGARGLMQLMPDTAREMAAKLGLDFDEQRLSTDGEYNKRLGIAYLDEMMQRYDGHQALALAAYNAGPGKVDEWLQHLGDPRSGQVGAEAWVQRIPFEETRNYTRNILHDLRRNQASVESADKTLPRGELERALQRNEQLRSGELLSQAEGLRPALHDEFNEVADSVAYQQKNSPDPQAGLHQSLSAAFAQPIRIEPKGRIS
jgi:soluble lytic murein transglycosylase